MTRPFSAFRAHSRDHRASILVAFLSSAFGVLLLAGTNVLSAYIGGSDAGEHSSVKVALTCVAAVFFIIAVYVGSIVTTNTFATIIAGRTRTIALLRLIGSSSRAQRRSVAREGLAVGILGATGGAAVATGVALAGVWLLVAAGVLPGAPYAVVTPALLAPVAVVAVTTWLASWVGSRRVLAVTPVQALGAAEERPSDASRGRSRIVAVALLLTSGTVLLIAGVLLGLGALSAMAPAVAALTHFGVLVALPGGVLSFTGVILAAPLFIPAVLRILGRLFGRGAPALLAAANAGRHPERSARTTIGLVIGVALVTMFVVAAESYLQMVRRAAHADPALYAGTEKVLTVTMVVFSVLVGFSAVIAAVGVVNALSLSVLQRRRELGLLRALGFSARQIRRMILAESAQIALAAVAIGLALGTLYGWIGAQSLLGSIPGGGLVVPVLPWSYLVTVGAGGALLAVLAAVPPTRRATAVSPVAALAVD